MRHTASFVIPLAVPSGIARIGTAANANAQPNTQHIKGVAGLQAGSQLPSRVYPIKLGVI